uniref:Uncharacterized protein n=1 Tax=Amphimedon queenslandica TaxID=400682 RepID=A0A1X7TLH6_AMPQE
MPRSIPVSTAALSSLMKSSGPAGGVRGARGEGVMGAGGPPEGPRVGADMVGATGADGPPEGPGVGTDMVGATGAGGPPVSPPVGINGIVGAPVLGGATIPAAPEGEERPVAGPLPAIASPEDTGVPTGVELDAEAIRSP